MSQQIRETPTVVHNTSSEKISYEEFLSLYADCHAEWVDGEVVKLSPASNRHQDLSDFLTAIMRFFVETYNLGVVRSAPFQMRLPKAAREPDLLFISSQYLDRLKSTYLEGAADVVVEIISPESQSRDRGDKFYEYEQAGVREYWLIDPIRKQAEFYQLKNDIYQLATLGEDNLFRSIAIEGLWLKVDWLWQEPLPLLMSVLKEWKLI
jgi:Uma2 family endonuclease